MAKYEKPYSEDMEAAVVGSIMIEGIPAVGKIRHLISHKDFYFEQYRTIYKAYEALYEERTEIDVLSVADWLRSNGYLEAIGGPAALTNLSNAVPSSVRVVSYAKSVSKYSILRKILGAAKDIGELSQRSDIQIDSLLQQAEEKIKNVTRESASKESKLEIADLADYMRIARENPTPEGMVRGLSTGLQKLDKMTQGFVPGEVMIVSGQTSHGKTQLSNNIMLNVMRTGKRVMFITMEMTKQEIGERFNLLTDNEEIPPGQILLNMQADLAYQDVTRLIERAKERGCDLVVIDHLHYFSRSVENATAEIGKIMKEFKGAAVAFEIPIVLICHVRKMEPKMHPTINDLRDSSMIAQDADMVVIVWRDERPDAKEPNKVEVVLWKNRSRQKKHRRDYLWAKGMTLVEEDPVPVSERAAQYAADTARQLGERDDDSMEDLLKDIPF